eukprot:9156367-Alexandrium_andersonii.AAC.4
MEHQMEQRLMKQPRCGEIIMPTHAHTCQTPGAIILRGLYDQRVLFHSRHCNSACPSSLPARPHRCPQQRSLRGGEVWSEAPHQVRACPGKSRGCPRRCLGAC